MWYCGECECESVSFCENGDENDGILFKTGENEEVVQTLGENLVKMRCFFGCRAVGRHGTGKMAVPNGRHGTVRRPTGRAMGRRLGTKPVEARHGRHDGPSRQDPHRAGTARRRAVPGRHGPLAIYNRWAWWGRGAGWSSLLAIGSSELVIGGPVKQQTFPLFRS